MVTYKLNTKYGGAVICQNCHTENKLDAKTCTNCGRSLAHQTTIIVPEKSLSPTRRFQISDIVDTYTDSLVLYVMGDNQPVIVYGDGEVVLGRHSDTDPQPNLDLTRYKAHTLGVSRRHATIHPTGDGYAIEDLGSSNGTYINENKLEPHVKTPLRNGDLVRLGQLMIFTYFSPKQASTEVRPVEQTLVLNDREQPDNGGSLQYLSERVLPYLSALSGMQMVIDEMLKREKSSGIRVRDISFEEGGGVVNVKVFGYKEAVQSLKNELAEWKKARIAKMETPEAPAKSETTQAEAGEQTGPLVAASVVTQPLVPDSLEGLARTILKGASANQESEPDKDESSVPTLNLDPFIQQLVPHLQILTSSNFEISVG